MKLIDKDKVILMLQDKIANIKLDMRCGFLKERKGAERICVLNNVISALDTLEVKEVDLEKEINLWFDYGFPNDEELLDYIKETAKHFFELGLKEQKGE